MVWQTMFSSRSTHAKCFCVGNWKVGLPSLGWELLEIFGVEERVGVCKEEGSQRGIESNVHICHFLHGNLYL